MDIPEVGVKRRTRERARGTQCLNCGLAIDSNYCPNCGQQNASHNHGLGQFLHEFMDEFLHLDSKIVRTLIPLFRKPGFLTQEWTAGKRMRYLSPLKLCVTFSAFCFLAMSFRGTLYKEAKSDFNISIDATKSQKADLPAVESSLDTLFKKKIGKPDKESIAAIRDKFIARLPTTNFLLMPVFAGIFALLYIRQKRFYVEHLVFTLHYYSFIFLVVTVTSLLPPQFLVSNVLRGIALLWMLAYLPIALVRNYQQGYLKTFVKLGIFGVVYGLVVTVALFGTLVVTAWALPDKQELPGSNMPAANTKEK